MFTKLIGTNYPIFHFQGNHARYYYTPGIIVRVRLDHVESFERRLMNGASSTTAMDEDQKFGAIIDAARKAETQLCKIKNTLYTPKCLTIYLNQKCNLDCQYCFSDLNFDNKMVVSLPAIYSALELVAGCCGRDGDPLTVGFHGGGEPILSWEIIDQIQPYLLDLSVKYGTKLFRYLSTNGVMTEKRAQWLAKSVDMVGLSCDGPPDIQTMQRPIRGRSRNTSSYYVERTGEILNESGVALQVRVTLTRNSFCKQEEICEYICNNFHPQSIHVEPVYFGGKARSTSLLHEEDVDCFVESYLKARMVANSYGSTWELSGTRMNSIHVAYCNIFRQVLQLVPGDSATACFKTINSQQTEGMNFNIGRFDPKNDRFVIDNSRIDKLRKSYQLPDLCRDCFISYHCTHNCPNACPLNQTSGADFLCKLNKNIAFDELNKYMKILDKSSEPISGYVIQ
ncbi:MAG: hypothetical protein AB9891_13000 [Anaerolineaceae bacterium]